MSVISVVPRSLFRVAKPEETASCQITCQGTTSVVPKVEKRIGLQPLRAKPSDLQNFETKLGAFLCHDEDNRTVHRS